MPITWPWRWLGCTLGGLSSCFFHCITFSTAILIEGSPGRKEAGGYAPSPLLAYKLCFAVVNRGPQAPQGLAKGSIEWQVNESPRPHLYSVLLLKLSANEMTPCITQVLFFLFEKILQKYKSFSELWSYSIAQVDIKPIIFPPQPLNKCWDWSQAVFFFCIFEYINLEESRKKYMLIPYIYFNIFSYKYLKILCWREYINLGYNFSILTFYDLWIYICVLVTGVTVFRNAIWTRLPQCSSCS